MFWSAEQLPRTWPANASFQLPPSWFNYPTSFFCIWDLFCCACVKYRINSRGFFKMQNGKWECFSHRKEASCGWVGMKAGLQTATIYSLLWLFTNDKKQEHYIPFNRPSWIPLVHIKWGFKSQSPLEPVVIGILIGIFSSSAFLNNQVQGPFEHFHAFSGD